MEVKSQRVNPSRRDAVGAETRRVFRHVTAANGRHIA